MRAVMLLAVFLAFPALCRTATIQVPGDYPTIQQAINAASTSDVVLVAPGTYTENINFLGKAIAVKSGQGPGVTVIDGNQSGSVVTFESGEVPDARLEGFSITNGSGSGGFSGGGVYLFNYSCPTLIGNIISSNTITSTIACGGGIYADHHSDPAIIDNVISGNTVKGGQYCHGGGIYCFQSSPVIQGNTISLNFADVQGGGIYMDRSSPMIEGNTISDNTSEIWGGGIVFCFDCSPVISDNVISGNKANQQGGGGIIAYSNCSGLIENNLITQNTAFGASGIYTGQNAGLTISGNTITHNHCPTAGGGIFCLDDSPLIIGNTIMQNTADQAGGGIHVTGNFISSPEVRNNLIIRNTCSEYGGGGIAVFFSSGVYSGNTLLENECLTWRGGGLAIISSSGEYSNNLICLNAAGNSGGGIHCSGANSAMLINNTVCANSGKSNSGGMRCDFQASVEVINSVFWGNVVTTGASGLQISVMDSSTLAISYSDVEGGEPKVYVSSNSTMYWGPGMIDVDPLFVDPAVKDYHLTYPSTCRDTGYDPAVIESEDFEGDPRIALGAVDMGADEFFTHFYHTGNAVPSGTVELKFVGLPGAVPVGFCIGTGILEKPLPSMWGDWYLKFPILGPVLLTLPIPSTGVLAIPGTLPPVPPAPYSVPMQAVIGDGLTNPYLLQIK